MRETLAVANAELAAEPAQPAPVSERQAPAERAPDGQAPDTRQAGGHIIPALRQVDRLLRLADAAHLFRAPDGIAYADLEIDGHRETWALRGRVFRRWLTQQMLAEGRGAPSSKALHDSLDLIETRALSSGPVRDVKVRLGGMEGRIYLDLGDAAWQAVEIDADGWRVVERPPLRFRRPAGAHPLPVPERGGNVTALRSFLNLGSEADLAMAVAWLVAALCDRGPYPVLVMAGDAGAGKSTFMAMLQALIDPGAVKLRSLPAGERALIAAAHDSYVLAFDNLSSLPGWFSDSLCRMVSGGGFASRHGDAAQAVQAGVARPVMLNGIADIITRPDLADRALFVTMNGIRPVKRRTEAELWAEFEAVRPRLLGVLLDAVAVGLGRLPRTRVREAPRMADLAHWVEACEPALFAPGAFQALYAVNRNGTALDAIESDPFIVSVREFVCRHKRWAGTATELDHEVIRVANEPGGPGSQPWPGNARVLASRLRQGATFLRCCGIEVAFERFGAHGTRLVRLSVVPGSRADMARPADATVRRASPLASAASD